MKKKFNGLQAWAKTFRLTNKLVKSDNQQNIKNFNYFKRVKNQPKPWLKPLKHK